MASLGPEPAPAAPTSRFSPLWLLALLLLMAVAARNLLALDTVPPGMYVDEASIGYNAWAIAVHGVDEHGSHFPLYFQAFGESKNPVYIYTLAALLRFTPLTSYAERVPAAVFGEVAVLFMALAAWRVSRSNAVTLVMLALAAVTPWLTQESRVGFEVISMVAALSVAIWCIADETRLTRARFLGAGVFFALAIFAYSTGRLVIALFAVVLVVVYARSRARGWWLALIPIVAGYAALGVWALTHPGALTAEFSLISIGADGASAGTVVARFFSNYIQYFSPDFLFIHGDPNPRHNTGFAGMLLAVTAPLLLLGLWECWRRRAQRLPSFLVLCLLVAPIPAALTNSGDTGHALRGAVMLPFILVLAALGATRLAALIRIRAAGIAVLAGGVAAQAALYAVDMYTAYPARAASAFDTGALSAVQVAASAAHGHRVFLSSNMDEQPYIDAFFVLLPAPPSGYLDDAAGRGLRLLNMVAGDAAANEAAAQPGDILVLAASDPRPARTAQLIDAERAAPAAGQRQGQLLYVVYRLA